MGLGAKDHSCHCRIYGGGTGSGLCAGNSGVVSALGSEAGTGLLSCKMALLINITGGSFYAIANLFYYVQVIMKEQRSIFMIYGIGCIVAAWLSPQMVKAWGIDGGAFSYLFLMILLTGMFLVSVMRNQRKVRKTM